MTLEKIKKFNENTPGYSNLLKFLETKRKIANDPEGYIKELNIRILNRIWTEIKLAFQYLPIKSKNENEDGYNPLMENPSYNFSFTNDNK